MRRMRERRASIAEHDAAARLRVASVDVIFGEGRFADARTIVVGGQRLRFARAVIATGGRPTAPPIPGLDKVAFLTNETMFRVDHSPPTVRNQAEDLARHDGVLAAVDTWADRAATFVARKGRASRPLSRIRVSSASASIGRPEVEVAIAPHERRTSEAGHVTGGAIRGRLESRRHLQSEARRG